MKCGVLKMKADKDYQKKPPAFFDAIRLISERYGYSTRRSPTREAEVKTISSSKVEEIFSGLKLNVPNETNPTDIAKYINYRAEILNAEVEPCLMDREQARKLYCDEFIKKKPRTPPIMNKQKGDKKHESYLACLVQIQAEFILGYGQFDNDPQRLAYLYDSNNYLIKCFARRFDGAVPSTANPKVVWEIKEYYGTTTFGSRVADGVYESLLDGFEIIEARKKGANVKHYLFIDDKFTWWGLGKSYLCRIIDMLHTRHVDNVYFGSQVVTQFPVDLKNDLKI
jgi:hypothetical protein